MIAFEDHVALFSTFLDRRSEIVEAIESRLLNVRDKDLSRRRDRQHFERLLESCFFERRGLPISSRALKGQLTAAHVADGFEPVPLDQYAHDMDPLELIVRAYEFWQGTRWPGKSGRLTFADMIFAVDVLSQLQHFSLRVWDAGTGEADNRLSVVQHLLDRLNTASPSFVRVGDARWLIQIAQGPLTRQVSPYFSVARHVSESFSDERRLEIHKAGAKLAGGHLRSQLRYRAWNSGRPVDDPELLAFNRNSNSMDSALLVRDLVPLLDAYRTAVRKKSGHRSGLADAILQGLSADPELLVVRLDLLKPYTWIEDLFVGTALGDEQLSLLDRYRELVAASSEALIEDAGDLDPGRQAYSPFGIVYGFCSDVLSNMAMAALITQAGDPLSFEDTFDSCGHLDEKLVRAHTWARLPRRGAEREHFEHSPDWGSEMFGRLISALEQRASRAGQANASDRPNARIFVSTHNRQSPPVAEVERSTEVASANEYCFTSDMSRAIACGATFQSEAEMIDGRHEGRFLASVKVDGSWFGVSKLVLTIFLAQGRHAAITGVPEDAIDVIRLVCDGLVKTEA
jgi:hypothetical protein